MRYIKKKNATIEIVLKEDDWYHIPTNLFDIEARSFKGERPDFIGKPVTKTEFMQVLGNMERLLVRAKYHTDQLEGSLHTAVMEFGSVKSLNLKKTLAVEKCLCPIGYEGLSCERCSYGYARVENKLYGGECRKCDCNGHAATCDPFDQRCGECQHNTQGLTCNECRAGFYGDPTIGTPGDCKRCKCPLELISNNFSPTCKIADDYFDRFSIAPDEYVCDACPRGYEGSHCERFVCLIMSDCYSS